jgi:O-antigen ligase
LHTSTALRQQTDNILRSHIVPFGLFLFLTGMFWIGDRSDFHRIFYILVAFPTTLALAVTPQNIWKPFNGIFLCALAFCSYTALTLLWSGTDRAASALKHSLYVILIFYAFTLPSLKQIRQIINASLIFATLSALISIAYFLYFDPQHRLPGYGALYNPLLTSHVYGMFSAISLSYLFLTNEKKWIWTVCFIVLTTLLLLTGSRTPLLALGASLLWLTLVTFNRRSIFLFSAGLALGFLLFFFDPEIFTNRGLSYRPDIWREAWLQIIKNPLWGHGYDHPMAFKVEGIRYTFADPHNLFLAVLFSGGILGLGLWFILYAVAIGFAWRNRSDLFVIAASTAVIFGLTAGITEGKAFISRPKEHWFLIWIPLSLLAATWLYKKNNTLEKFK